MKRRSRSWCGGIWTASIRARGAAWEAVEHGTEELKVAGEEPLRREIATFLDCVARRAPTPVDAVAGLRALEVVEAAARSSRLGRRVTLDELKTP